MVLAVDSLCHAISVGTVRLRQIVMSCVSQSHSPFQKHTVRHQHLAPYDDDKRVVLCAAGYVSGVWYKMMGGRHWVSNVLLVSVLFCGPLLAVFSVLNTIAWVQGSTQALPFGTICIIIVIWALVTFPLTVLGGIAGKNSKDEFNAPCR